MALICHNDLDNFENWITRLICNGKSTPELGLEAVIVGAIPI